MNTNTNTLRQGLSALSWMAATIGIAIAIPWLIVTGAIALAALTGGALAVQQWLAMIVSMDGLQWRVGVPYFWSAMTWLSAACVFAYRITKTAWFERIVFGTADLAGRWIRARSTTLYTRLGGTQHDAGKLSIALIGTVGLVVIAGSLALLSGSFTSSTRQPARPLAKPKVLERAALVMPDGQVVSGNAHIDRLPDGQFRVTFQ